MGSAQDRIVDRKLLDGAMAQMDNMMQTAIQHAIAGQPLNPDQQKILSDMRAQMVTMFKEEMKWETMEPMIVDIYSKSFTEQEIRGMLDFYKSPSGQAVIAKMPLVMQNTMQQVQVRRMGLMPRLEQLQRDTIARLKASGVK